METLHCLALFFVVFLLISYKLLQKKHHRKKLPPSPPSLPIIGHFHLLKKPLQVSIDRLLKRYGPILFLQFGSRPVLVLSSTSAVEECFTKNDVTFSNRPLLLSGKHLNYNYTTVGVAPYGDLWRNLRRVTTIEIFSTTRLQMTSSIRTEEVWLVIRQMIKGSEGGGLQKVELQSIFCKLTFNMVMRMLGVKQYFGEEEMVGPEKARQRLEDMKQTFYQSVMFAVGDFFPFLRWIDIWTVQKKMVKLHRKRDGFMQGLIDECRSRRSSSFAMEGERQRIRTIIDDLLSIQEKEPEYYTDDIIKGIIQIMLSTGSDTTATTMEWAMSLLLNHPEVLKKARDEIDLNVGHGSLLNESDLVKLPYLHNIINETLRLCSLGPFLVRESSKECTVGGFDIPRGTMLMVNIFAIHKDPKEWLEPTMFKPERFQGEKEGFKWLAFGSKRRRCPGEAMAMRMIGLILGTLIQCFDLERVGGEMVDMSVSMERLTIRAKPLEAMYKPRKTLLPVLSQL